MNDKNLFDTVFNYAEFVKRNIVLVTEQQEAFQSLIDNLQDLAVIDSACRLARSVTTDKNKQNDFYYTQAISYPFKTLTCMETRYSDGSYPVWYGSKEIETSVYETLHYTLKFIHAEAGVEREEKIVRPRTVFNVSCSALLLDLRGKEKRYPKICADHHRFTQRIGKAALDRGMPGIISHSARKKGGSNINIFTASVLRDPVVFCQLKYIIYPKERNVIVSGLENPLKITY